MPKATNVSLRTLAGALADKEPDRAVAPGPPIGRQLVRRPPGRVTGATLPSEANWTGTGEPVGGC